MKTLQSPKFVAIVLALILLLAAYVRIDFLRSVNHEMSPDAVHYDAMAKQLLDKGIYAYNDTKPNALVAPGYPLLLTGIYALVDYRHHDPLPYVRYLQALLSVAVVWLVYRIAATLSNETIGLFAAAVAAVYPPLVWMNGAILTESLAVFCLLAYVWVQLQAVVTESRLAAAAAGALLGLTVLTRPEFMPLLAAVYLFVWLWRRNTYVAATLFVYSCVGFAIVMMPWWIRNAVTLHEWVLTATQTNPFSAGTYPYKNYDDGLIDTTGLTEKEIGLARLRVGFATEPWLFLKWYTVGKLRYIYEYMYAGGGYTPYYPVLPLRDPNRLHLAIVWTSVAAMIAIVRHWRQLATIPVLIIVVMSLIRLGFVPEYRYNVTIMPLMIVIGCIFLAQLARAALYGRRSELGRSGSRESGAVRGRLPESGDDRAKLAHRQRDQLEGGMPHDTVASASESFDHRAGV